MTRREQDVLHLILKGKRNREICAELGLAPGTVKTHLQSLFKQFGVHTRLELALKAVEHGRQPVVTRRVIMGVQL